ncbi:GNAT family N-acetyltransferase [Oceanibium sediminis]|uniref:GNAT family N-acetyltransferase n=1 Tax=Oceanibium sediminis TaxID=2026339 RepID=UPI000DD2EC5C|nr:GNAT family N-acetyltransferase [Oceanibium sediminis]
MTPYNGAITFRSYRSTDRDWVHAAHLHHYEKAEGFSPDFGDAVSGALDLLEARIGDGRSRFTIAEAAGHRVGCIFFCAETAAAGRIRLFYLDPAHRGRGIGKAMLTGILDHAAREGVETVLVSTFDRHRDACRLYAALGFLGTTGAERTAFGQRLRQVDFTLDLADHRTG